MALVATLATGCRLFRGDDHPPRYHHISAAPAGTPAPPPPAWVRGQPG